MRYSVITVCLILMFALGWNTGSAQMPVKYATLELFTNTPCPICGSSNPGFFDRLENYEGEYHLISFWPGKPYSSCIFYQSNISENTARFNFYPMVFGTPTVAINGTEFRSSGSVSNTILDGITGGTSWLSVDVEETTGTTRSVNITLQDHVGGSLDIGKLFAVIVEREIMYNAPNGETLHHNVFRKFLTSTDGEDADLSSGTVTRTYQYDVDNAWQEDEVYVIAWLSDPESREIYNSGTKFDPNTTSTKDLVETSLQVYPNPATSEINIVIPENTVDAPVRIFDASGSVVFSTVTTGQELLTIGTGRFPAGSYHAEITTGEKVITGRFQVIR